MFLSIIHVLSNFPIILILYYFYRADFREQNQSILAVGVNGQMRADAQFSKIRSEYERFLRRILCVSLLLIVSGALLLNTGIREYVSAVVFLLLLPLFLHIYLTNRLAFYSRRRLLSLKEKYREKNEADHILYVDLVTSRLKNEKNPGGAWFIPPLLMNALLCFWTAHDMMKTVVFVSFLMTLLCFAGFRMIFRMPSKIYSVNSQKNLVLNQAYRQKWSGFFLLSAYFFALLHFLLGLFFARCAKSLEEVFTAPFFLSFFLLGILPAVLMFRIHRSYKEMEARILKDDDEGIDPKNEERFYVEDGFWGLQYSNPKNPAMIVNAPMGIGQAVNIGNPKGRILYYGSKLIFYAVMILALGIGLFEDISFPRMAVSSGEIRIYQTLYPLVLDTEDITRIEMTDRSFEKGELFKVTGSATSRILRGDFRMKEAGRVKLYTLKREGCSKIIFHVKDRKFVRIYFSAENEEKTKALFESLQSDFPDKIETDR